MRWSLLQKSGDTFLEICGLRRRGLQLGLTLELLLQRRVDGVVEQAFGHADAARGQVGELTRELRSTARERVRLEHLGDEAPRVRLRGRELLARREPFEGARRPEEA